MRVFLIGLPGSGKSTLGKTLSKVLALPFFDLDEEIVSRHKMSIPEIFKEHGEEFFRKSEKEALRNLAKNESSCVIATGGGTPCFFDNMDFINENGKSIFLDISPAEIVNRLNEAEMESRPLLSSEGNRLQKLENLLIDRIKFYKEAHITVDVKMSLLEVISILKKY